MPLESAYPPPFFHIVDPEPVKPYIAITAVTAANMSGRDGGMISAKFNPSERASIWEEHLKKEAKSYKFREDFTVNPRTMVLIAEQITGMKRHAKYRRAYSMAEHAEKAVEEEKDWIKRYYALDEGIIKGLQASHLSPQEKFQWAPTANMEYG